jgi:integrase
MILRAPRVHCYFPAGTPSLRPPRAHCTVLRRGEALALRWPDVDLERGALRIRETLRIDGRLLVTEPETAKSKRFVPISVQTERLLRDLRDARPRSACAPARPGSRAATCSPPSSANPATRATPCGPSRQRPPGPGSRRGPAPAPALGGQRDAHAWRPAPGGLRGPRPLIGRDHRRRLRARRTRRFARRHRHPRRRPRQVRVTKWWSDRSGKPSGAVPDFSGTAPDLRFHCRADRI